MQGHILVMPYARAAMGHVVFCHVQLVPSQPLAHNPASAFGGQPVHCMSSFAFALSSCRCQLPVQHHCALLIDLCCAVPVMHVPFAALLGVFQHPPGSSAAGEVLHAQRHWKATGML